MYLNLSPNICAPKETKDINVKTFSMIPNKKKLKQWQNIFRVITNADSTVQLAIHIKNGITKRVSVNVKISYMQKRL